ncbi:sporulation membrane protein YtaF [Paenibacillus sp. JCM 10914]|uniref:MntP/YtaF family protein n=1 Tax=Paenibacillus sp. JCM 10914 TaxID=1236974 RepID=UPI0003CC752A|nr:MntP/YtaF family protein [Paenibacillus sp. JCM 10914]GAE06963.1 hypothetical protein JCM10914_3159 [Paenibacillus sp. JCM 10914]
MLSHIIPSVLLAMAISLDGFGAGVTYGLRKTKIPALSVLIISFCSGLVLCISMMAGSLLQRYLSPDVASIIGAAILIVLGGWSLYQQLIRKPDSDVASGNASREEQTISSGEVVMETAAATEVNDMTARNEPTLIPKAVFSLEIPKMGVVIQILRSPSKADLDDSGSISPWEAMWLGIALSLDAFGAGLGAAMLGFSPLGTAAIVALFSGIFLIMGMKVGLRFASRSGMRFISFAPALLLMVMGIMKLL